MCWITWIKLVVKAVGESGGYGMLIIGPHSTQEIREQFSSTKILANPRDYIAQPTIQLSRAPCFIDGKVVACHVDLRPYILYGDQVTIPAGSDPCRTKAWFTGCQLFPKAVAARIRGCWPMINDKGPTMPPSCTRQLNDRLLSTDYRLPKGRNRRYRVADSLYWMSR